MQTILFCLFIYIFYFQIQNLIHVIWFCHFDSESKLLENDNYRVVARYVGSVIRKFGSILRFWSLLPTHLIPDTTLLIPSLIPPTWFLIQSIWCLIQPFRPPYPTPLVSDSAHMIPYPTLLTLNPRTYKQSRTPTVVRGVRFSWNLSPGFLLCFNIS